MPWGSPRVRFTAGVSPKNLKSLVRVPRNVLNMVVIVKCREANELTLAI